MVSHATALMTEGLAWDRQQDHRVPLPCGQSWHLPRTICPGWRDPRLL